MVRLFTWFWIAIILAALFLSDDHPSAYMKPDIRSERIELHTIAWKGGEATAVRLVGDIRPGQVERIMDNIALAALLDRKPVALELLSYGGDAQSGMAIARLVERRNMAVYVDDVCSSACSYAALIALGNGKLFVGYGAHVGVHQVRDSITEVADKPWTKRAARTLAKWGAPRQPLDAMVATKSSEMAYFSAEELKRLGAQPAP